MAEQAGLRAIVVGCCYLYACRGGYPSHAEEPLRLVREVPCLPALKWQVNFQDHDYLVS